MRQMFLLIKRDAQKITSNVISLLVCMGLVIIPSMYAWFNIEASWDPYQNTSNLKVAVANCDEGYTSDLIPVEINIGDKVVTSLREKTNIDYIFLPEEDQAIEGIKSGEYYAAIIIPKNFSENLMTVFSDDAQPAELIYYSNEKENSIASIVTDKASNSIRTEIDTSFTESITSIGARTLSSITKFMDGDQVLNFADKLNGQLSGASTKIGQAADSLEGYGAIVLSLKDIMQASESMLEGPQKTAQKSLEALSGVSDKLTSAGDDLQAIQDEIKKPVESLQTTAHSIESDLNEAFDVADTNATRAYEILDNVANEIQKKIDVLTKSRDTLNSHHIDTPHLDDSIDQMKDLKSSVVKAANKIKEANGQIAEDRANIKAKLTSTQDSLKRVQESYANDLKPQLETLKSSVLDAVQKAQETGEDLSETTTAIKQATATTSQDLDTIHEVIVASAENLREAQHHLDGLIDEIHDARNSGDIQKIKTILSADPKALATFLSNPVGLQRNPVYPVQNNGSAMAPFYTTLSIWVGCTILVALVKVNPSEHALEELGHPKPRFIYFGRFFFFFIVSCLQATLLGLGNLFYLNIQCMHPWYFLLTCWFTAFVYMNVIYSLVVSFGDVGKAIAVLLLVVQVAGSGGSFPQEMLPIFFQKLYPWLPFVSSMNAMRACIAGIYQLELYHELLWLGHYIVPSLLLGLVLRKPVIRLNEWVEHQLESTKIM